MGFYQNNGFNLNEAIDSIHVMMDELKHRGPDDKGLWVDASQGIALSHRRLSIVDLTKAGNQPMFSQSGRYVLAYNGEIYNHKELRFKIEAKKNQKWIGTSDTETILVAVELWGLEFTVKSSVGMFAFALFDREEKKLYLVRDRMGEKPLYYGWQNDVLLFGSELKSLIKHPKFEARIDENAIPNYLHYGYIPTPYCIWLGIKKMDPGTIIEIDINKDSRNPDIKEYWSFKDIAKNGELNPLIYDENTIAILLEDKIKESVRNQMISDVPIGAFLSGGIDSSLIVSIMQSISADRIKTFSVGYANKKYNEVIYAQEIADYLGTDHENLYITSEMALSSLPKVSEIFDEPFSDISAIPTYLLSKYSSRKVTVTLSGDAGDELFGGYTRYQDIISQWEKINFIPKVFRKNIQTNIFGLIKILNYTKTKYPTLFSQFITNDDYLERLYSYFVSDDIFDLYQSNISRDIRNKNNIKDNKKVLDFISDYHKLMASDSLNYLPDEVLVKVDRATMAASIENRVPFLDHRIVEFAWQIPVEMKVRNRETKWILKKLLNKYIPINKFDRPKMGFGMPIDQWLRSSMKIWAEELLFDGALMDNEYFDSEYIYKSWKSYINGNIHLRDKIWTYIMWQSWYNKYAI